MINTYLRYDMCECKLCGKEQKSLRNLSKHLSNNHKYSPKEYYDTYLKKHNEDTCLICNKETKYYMFTEGYRTTCSKSCASKLYRKHLKNDTEKFEIFREKVAVNQEKIWADRKENGTARAIHNKVGDTITANNVLLTNKERQDRFGWLNKLSSIEKEIWKTDVMFNTGCHLWWKNATEEQRNDQQVKRCATMIKNGSMIDPIFKSEKQRYYDRVRSMSYRNYKKFKSLLNPHDFLISRGNRGYHLDHIFSIQQGFLNNVPSKIIASVHNLQILSGEENNKKSVECWQTLEELLEKYNG